MLVRCWRGLGATLVLGLAGCLGKRHVGGTGAIAVDDGRKQLHVGSEDLGHGLLFGLAELREFLGDVRYRAVVLADLHTVDRSADSRRGGDVAGPGQCGGDPLSGRLDIGIVGTAGRLNTGQNRVDASPRERRNRVLSADLT